MSVNGLPILFGAFIPMLLSFLFFLAFGVMLVYGFILLVKFLRAGTKAFNMYVENNKNSNFYGKDNGESEIK